jgi:hypothetical protein
MMASGCEKREKAGEKLNIIESLKGPKAKKTDNHLKRANKTCMDKITFILNYTIKTHK